ncbi:MAG: sodium-dependent transporter [Acidimicrobiia bacterium]
MGSAPERTDATNAVLSAIADAARFPRPVWRSERAYVLATIAGVVGLGNIWRFPYMAGRHGGGSFVLAYVVCVVLVAVPLASLESAAGSLVRRSPVGAFRRAAGRPGAAIGWAVVGMTGAILSYYLVVTGWTLGYLLDSLRGDLESFEAFTRGYASVWLLVAVGALVLAVLVRGVGTIERAGLVVVPLLVAIVAGLAVYGQTLDGAAESRAFYLGLSGEHLFDAATWRAAAGQAFYSVGVGQGVLIAYGSFVPAGTNLIRSTAAVAVTNSLVSIIAGLMVFGVVFTFGISPSTGSQLSFTAFPRVFGQVPGGAVLAVGFFALLLLAGFTSCLGASIVVMSTVRDELRLRARTATALTVAAVVVLGIPSALSFSGAGLTVAGEPFLDRVDQLTGSGAIVVLGVVGSAVLALSLPRRALAAAFGSRAEVRVGPVRLGARSVIGWTIVLSGAAAVMLAASML